MTELEKSIYSAIDALQKQIANDKSEKYFQEQVDNGR